MTQPPQPGPREPEQLALDAARAAGAVMPAAEPLEAPGVQPGTEQVTGLFAGAVVADLTGGTGGTIGLLVAGDLVTALAESPVGDLELSAAVQPALDAAAASFGAAVGAAREVELDTVVAEIVGSTDTTAFSVVPLIGDSITAALLVADAVLVRIAGGAAAAAPEPASVPTAAPAPAQAAAPSEAPVAPGIELPEIPRATAPAAPAEAGPAASSVLEAAIHAGPAMPVTSPQMAPGMAGASRPRRGIELLNDVDMEVTVELGRTRMAMRDLLALTPGHVLELDRAAGAPADLLVNGHLIARGEVVVVDEDFGLRVTEILETSTAN